MPNITTALNDQIRRVSRREINGMTKSTRKLTTQHRRDVASLKRQVASLLKTVAFLEQQERRRVAEEPVQVKELDGVRFRSDGLRSRRMRLGLSAEDYGRLLGVSGPTVYLWETGKVRPKREQVARLAAIRGLGKREAEKRLEMLGAAPAGKKRSQYPETADEFIQAIVKSKKATTSSQINAAWRKSGRPGKADNTLTRLVASRVLKRAKLENQRGSRYSIH
ncbi:MAG TPA: helix-turn-helix transcriptional regulator [Tepidisphaeraceae bacterium]|nr:helix-turn-helix transcriptional regulator [Tepidisphaeraceae bacterium]